MAWSWILLLFWSTASVASDVGAPAWVPWSDGLFAQAQREKKLVLLSLESFPSAECRQMNEKTYRSPEVVRALSQHYVVSKVDQAARPDLANRYARYGWPATVVFWPDGREASVQSGWISPERMASLLRALPVKPKTAMPHFHEAATPVSRSTPQEPGDLEKLILSRYDSKRGGWDRSRKFLDHYLVQYLSVRARKGDADAERFAKQTLQAQLSLLDPVSGGFYDESGESDWKKPRFERSVFSQAKSLIAYSEAYAQWKDPEHLKVARSVERFLNTPLSSPEGAFYASQAAAPAEKATLDTAVYTRENGWAIQALLSLRAATGDAAILGRAEKALRWILANRSLKGGGFGHGSLADGPYLGDQVILGHVFLKLYRITGRSEWLKQAESLADFIGKTFERDSLGGVRSASVSKKAVLKPVADAEENFQLATFAHRLHLETGKQVYKTVAQQALRFLSNPVISNEYFMTAPTWLAVEEMASKRTSP